MLYTRAQLLDQTDEEMSVAVQRYLHKIHKKETRKLLPHECDYLTIRLRSIYKFDENGQPIHERVFDIYDMPYLSETVFRYLIYVYFQNLDFLQPVFNGIKNLSRTEIERDKEKFDELLADWRVRLNHESDLILHEVKLEYLRKIAILDRQKAAGAFGHFRYLRHCLEQELLAFYIYLTVKIFFKDLRSNYVEAHYGNHRFIINVYSYVHILSRHYIPMFNGIDTEKSFNDALPFIEPFKLPISLADLLSNYFKSAPVDYILNPEYMLFDYQGAPYIIWWKEKKIDEIGGQIGFEVRTLYKIHSASDRALLEGKSAVKILDGLNFYY